MKKLTKEQVVLLHKALVAESGGSSEIRDEGLLDSALNAPFQTFSGTELYPTVLEKAARLGYGLIKNHPFVDGNKRIGTHVMLVFLMLNHFEVEYNDNDLVQLILGVASGEIDDRQLLVWLQQHLDWNHVTSGQNLPV
jgi:death-on-curing protein